MFLAFDRLLTRSIPAVKDECYIRVVHIVKGVLQYAQLQ